MLMNSMLAFVADTLLVRPVDVPAPWYSVATGILSIVVTLLLLGIAVALLGMARALKGAEKNLGGRMQGLADELIPLARNLNQIATQLSEFTTSARGDLTRLSGTIGAVDDAVRDAIDASESRLAQFGTLLDAVQDEAEATVASAAGVMRGMRTGAGAMVSSLFGRNGSTAVPRRSRRHPRASDRDLLDEADVRERLAALEAAFAERAEDDDDDDDDDEDLVDESPLGVRGRFSADAMRADADSEDDWDDDDDEDDDDAPALADDEDALDDEADDDLDDDEPDDDDQIDDDEDDDAAAASVNPDPEEPGPRTGGPRIHQRRRA
jgi:hypothetical protein